MIAHINRGTDGQGFGPLDLAAYLRGQGWDQVRRLDDRGAIWMLRLPEGDAEILLPLDYSLPDFQTRLTEALHTLAAVEGRSVEAVVRDLGVTNVDLVWVRLIGESSDSGSVPIDQGVRLFAETREIFLAAACAAVAPRPIYHTRRPAQATEYLERVRLGPTAPGSYTLTVRCPVSPRLTAPPDQAHFLHLVPPVEEPYERQVTTTLLRSLAALRSAAQEAASKGDWQPFNDAVPQGVSANLCDAVAELVGESPRQAVEVSIRWSVVRPPAVELPKQVRITGDSVPVIREAARIFRETSPREETEVEGLVVKLERGLDAEAGTVTIDGLVDAALRKVRVQLAGNDYRLAIRAHEDWLRVRCHGTLVKENRAYWLRRNAYGLELVRDPELV